LFSIYLGGFFNTLGGDSPKKFELITELCKKYIYIGIGMFLAGTLMVCCWSYSGRRIANHIKEEYFLIMMRQEQAWFDQQEIFEFSTKIQNQTKIIENGVNYFLKIFFYILSFWDGVSYIFILFYLGVILHFLDNNF
jgi:ATP-binding cassette subfamily B (MDR/TAP) protein 1